MKENQEFGTDGIKREQPVKPDAVKMDDIEQKEDAPAKITPKKKKFGSKKKKAEKSAKTPFDKKIKLPKLTMKLGLIIAGCVVAVAAIVAVIVFFVTAVHHSVTINGATESEVYQQDGISTIDGELSIECNAIPNENMFECEDYGVEGLFETGANFELVTPLNAPDGRVNTEEGKLYFTTVKTGVLGGVEGIESELASPIISTYEITIREKNNERKVFVYNLTVKTSFTEEDKAMIIP